MKSSLRHALVLACCGLSSASWAVGLGNIVVRSHLHQRLHAEIAVTTGTPGEAAAVAAELARGDELARAGSGRTTGGVDLLVSVQHLADGRAVIVVETNRPVDEPSLSFMIAADAGRGRVLRQYSITLDPGGGLADRTEVEPQPGSVPEAAPAPEALPTVAAPAKPASTAASAPAKPAPPVASAPPAPSPAKPAPTEAAKPVPTTAAASPAPAKPAVAEPPKPVAAAPSPPATPPGSKPAAGPAGSGTIARGTPEAATAAKPATAAAPKPDTVAPTGPSNAELAAAAKRAEAEVAAKEREAAALRDKVKELEQGTPETRREIAAKNAEIERLRHEIESTAKQVGTEAPRPDVAAPVPAQPPAATPTPAPAPASTPTAAPPAGVEPATAESAPADSNATAMTTMPTPIWVWLAGGLLLVAVGAVVLLLRRGKKGPAMEWVVPEGTSASPSAAILDAPREATVDHATASLDLTLDDLPSVSSAAPAPATAANATAVMASPVAAPKPPAAPTPASPAAAAPAAKAPPAVPVGRSPSPLSLEQEVASAQARMPAANSRPSLEIKPLDADLASLAEALQEFEPHEPPPRSPAVPAAPPAALPPSKSNPFLRESPGLSLEEQPESHLVPMPGAFEHELHEAFPDSPIAKERHVVDYGDPFKKPAAAPAPAPVVEAPDIALSRALGGSVPERATVPEATLESELQAAADAVLGDDDELRAPTGRDAVATKLELARAYLDMDDDESAAHILEEVINEGDAEQKQTATTMLAEARKR